MKIEPPNSFSPQNKLSRREFIERVGIVTAAVLILALFWYGAEVFLLIFAGLLLAVFFNAISNWVSRRTGLDDGWALTIVLLGLILIFALGIWLMYAPIRNQFEQLAETLPQAVEKLRAQIAQSSIGRRILEQIPSLEELGGSSANVLGRVTGIFSSVLGALANFIIILAVGVFFAVNPKQYREGAIYLLPERAQKRAGEFLDAAGYTLRWWLVGRLGSMLINGVVTFIGLWLLGVPLPLPLAIICALFNFIPNIGPTLGSIPAILIALTQGQMQALYVIILYLIVQNLDGQVLTPIIQQKVVNLPPVLVIGVQLLMGVLFGVLGLALAVPLFAVIFVAVKMLYVEDVPGRKINVKAEEKTESRTNRDEAKIHINKGVTNET